MVLSILSKVAPFLFRFVEAKFKPKTGSTKMETVLGAVKVILEALGKSGDLGQAPPEDSELRTILEKLLTEERAKPDWVESGTLEARGKKLIVQIIGEIE